MNLQPIKPEAVQAWLDKSCGQMLYLHLETTNGAYAAQWQQGVGAVGAFVRNARISYSRALIQGTGPYRAGLQMPAGWVYAEGLTHWEVDGDGRLLLAGHDNEGRLSVALQLSPTPFAV